MVAADAHKAGILVNRVVQRLKFLNNNRLKTMGQKFELEDTLYHSFLSAERLSNNHPGTLLAIF
jgi:hypothetical protein